MFLLYEKANIATFNLADLGNTQFSPILPAEFRGVAAAFAEVEVSWAGLTGGDAAANITGRLRGFARGYTTATPTLSDWVNLGNDHLGVTDGDVANAGGSVTFYTNNPAIAAASRAACWAKSMGGLNVGMNAKMDPKVAIGITRGAGTTFTGGTITIARISFYVLNKWR